MRLHRRFEHALNHQIALSECVRAAAQADFGGCQDITGAFLVHLGRAVGQRRIRIVHCRQRLDVHVDQPDGLLQYLAAPGDHQRHRIAGVTDFAVRQHRHVLVHDALAIRARHILRGQHLQHAAQRLGCRRPDAADTAVRDAQPGAGAHRARPQHTLRIKVRRVGFASLGLGARVGPRLRPPNRERAHRIRHHAAPFTARQPASTSANR